MLKKGRAAERPRRFAYPTSCTNASTGGQYQKRSAVKYLRVATFDTPHAAFAAEILCTAEVENRRTATETLNKLGPRPKTAVPRRQPPLLPRVVRGACRRRCCRFQRLDTGTWAILDRWIGSTELRRVLRTPPRCVDLPLPDGVLQHGPGPGRAADPPVHRVPDRPRGNTLESAVLNT